MREDPLVRIRRLFAFFIDRYIIGGAVIFLIIGTLLLPTPGGAFIPFFLLFLLAAYWYARDWLFGGRSIGKRALGLSVVDGNSGAPATGKQLLLKDISVLLLPFDAAVLLLTGRSIGERISGTAVIPDTFPCPIPKDRLLLAVAVAAALALPFTFLYA